MPEQDKLRLGSELRRVQKLRGASLKSVAKPAGISAAYLLKLERNDVQSPSPHILRRLAERLDVSYLKLMRLAGYDVSEAEQPTRRAGVLVDALAAEPLTEDEQQTVAAFLSTLRAGRSH
jgi:transcriptional regulator with XRE-family HTH domain